MQMMNILVTDDEIFIKNLEQGIFTKPTIHWTQAEEQLSLLLERQDIFDLQKNQAQVRATLTIDA